MQKVVTYFPLPAICVVSLPEMGYIKTFDTLTRISIKTLALLVVAGVWMTACQGDKGSEIDSSGRLTGGISISGAFALYPLAVKWGEEFNKLHPELQIDIQPGGSGKGVAEALGGQVDLGMVSRDLNKEELTKGAWVLPVAKDAVVPTFSDKNPFASDILRKGVKKEIFYQLWIEGKPLTWGGIAGRGQQEPVKVYKRADAAGAAESWAKYLGKKQDDLKGTGVSGDPGLVKAIKSDADGIGFNNVIYAYDQGTGKPHEGLLIVPIDLNGNGKLEPEENFYHDLDEIKKAIADEKYPSPPARELFFIAKGKPHDVAVTAFLKWILTDGQKYVGEAGFIKLSEDRIREGIDRLK